MFKKRTTVGEMFSKSEKLAPVMNTKTNDNVYVAHM